MLLGHHDDDVLDEVVLQNVRHCSFNQTGQIAQLKGTLVSYCVPEIDAALRFELTEYASLLRALRTRDGMDLTAHLTKPSPLFLHKVNQ